MLTMTLFSINDYLSSQALLMVGVVNKTDEKFWESCVCWGGIISQINQMK